MGQVSRMWKELNMDEKRFYSDQINHDVENVEPKIIHTVNMKEGSITGYKSPNSERSTLGVLQLFQDNRSLSLSVSQNTNTSSITKQQKFQFVTNQQALEAMRTRNETVRAETEALKAQNESKRLDFFAKFLSDD